MFGYMSYIYNCCIDLLSKEPWVEDHLPAFKFLFYFIEQLCYFVINELGKKMFFRINNLKLI